jgi:hypothetical protein
MDGHVGAAVPILAIMDPPSPLPGWRRALRVVAVVGLVLVVCLLALQLAATPIARFYTHRTLNRLRTFEGTAADIHASVFPPSYSLSDLTLVERSEKNGREPFIRVEHVGVSIAWRKLLRGAVVASVVVDNPRLHVVTVTRAQEPSSPESPKSRADRLTQLQNELQLQLPLKVGQVVIHRGAVTVIEASQQTPAKLELSDLEFTIDDLATRAARKDKRPTVLDGHGTLQRSGLVSVHISADPWAKSLNFNGRVSLQHLQVTDMESLLASTTKLEATKGTVDLFAEFRAREGHITGGVKPVLHDVELAPAKSSPWTALKAWVADVALDLFSKKKDGEHKVATVVPIRGSVTDPKAQLWPTILGVVRNAFVEGVNEGFSNVPPNTAAKKQSSVEQLGNALNKSKGPPKAQPTNPKRQGRH